MTAKIKEVENGKSTKKMAKTKKKFFEKFNTSVNL